MVTVEHIQSLAKPFSGSAISWRVGATTKDKKKGMALAYIDARDVMVRFDEVCGAAGWQCRYSHADRHIICEIGVKVDGEWIWKANGAGDTDVEAVKGGLSDALKRAAVMWGVGRYLYDMPSPWVKIEPRGRSYVITSDEQARLAELAHGRKMPPSQDRSEPPKPITKPSKDASRPIYKKMQSALDGCVDLNDLRSLWNDARFKEDKLSLPPDWQAHIEEQYREIKQHLEQKAV